MRNAFLSLLPGLLLPGPAAAVGQPEITRRRVDVPGTNDVVDEMAAILEKMKQLMTEARLAEEADELYLPAVR